MANVLQLGRKIDRRFYGPCPAHAWPSFEVTMQPYGPDPIYDPQALQALSTRLPTAAASIVNLFRLHTPDVITILYTAVYYEDWGMVHLELVRLRGSSLAVGGLYLAELCRNSERSLLAGETEQLGTAIERIEHAFDELMAVFPPWGEPEPVMIDDKKEVRQDMKRIIVFNDQRSTLDMYVRILEMEGYIALAHLHASITQAEFEAAAPDLVLLDWTPGLEQQGFDLLRHIKRYPGAIMLPTIVCTASSDRRMVLYTAMLEAMDVSVLRKPFQVPELLVLLDTRLKLEE